MDDGGNGKRGEEEEGNLSLMAYMTREWIDFLNLLENKQERRRRRYKVEELSKGSSEGNRGAPGRAYRKRKKTSTRTDTHERSRTRL